MNWGQNLKEARIDAGMTQRELAEKVGCSAAAIMRYEKGQRQPNSELIIKLANALSVTPCEIMGFAEIKKVKVIPDISLISTKDLLKEIERRCSK